LPIDNDYRKLCAERASSPTITDAFTQYRAEHLGLVHIDQVRPRRLDGFLVTLDQRGLRGSSRRRKVAAICSLFHFLVQQGILPASPADEILPPEREREERRVLTENETKRLMRAVQHEVRDGAILELLLQTGIRQSECAAIALCDIQLPARVRRDEGNVGSPRVNRRLC
jgi:integrase/recombinase XerC